MMLVFFIFVEFLQGVYLFRGCAPELDNLILSFRENLLLIFLWQIHYGQPLTGCGHDAVS